MPVDLDVGSAGHPHASTHIHFNIANIQVIPKRHQEKLVKSIRILNVQVVLQGVPNQPAARSLNT